MSAIEQVYNTVKKKWEPKEWKPEYEEIVLLKAKGLSNKILASKFDCTPQHISNIITTDQAKKIRREIIENLRDTGLSQHQRKLLAADKALERIENYFADDEEFSKRKGAMVDRGMKFLTGVGQLKSENAGSTNNVVAIGNELGSQLLAALTKSDQVREKYVIQSNGLGQGEVEVSERTS